MCVCVCVRERERERERERARARERVYNKMNDLNLPAMNLNLPASYGVG